MFNPRSISSWGPAIAACVAWIGFAEGCRLDMHDQPRYEPLEYSSIFEDGRSSRKPVPGTVARGSLYADESVRTGRRGEAWVKDLPMPLTAELLARGEQRYNIYCVPCHDRSGTGVGIVVQRGFPPPPSFHSPRLREAALGHLFDVITRGYGAMYGYGARIKPHDRWAIVAHLRTLQLSQYAHLDDVPAAAMDQLDLSDGPL